MRGRETDGEEDFHLNCSTSHYVILGSFFLMEEKNTAEILFFPSAPPPWTAAFLTLSVLVC